MGARKLDCDLDAGAAARLLLRARGTPSAFRAARGVDDGAGTRRGGSRPADDYGGIKADWITH